MDKVLETVIEGIEFTFEKDILVNAFNILKPILSDEYVKNAINGDINLDKLLENRTSNIKSKEISKYLGMQKDVAFVVNNSITKLQV